MTDNATTELEYLLLRASELLQAISKQQDEPAATSVSELLEVRSRIAEELENVADAEAKDWVADVDADIKGLSSLIVAAAGGSLTKLRSQQHKPVLDWWWYLDGQQTNVEWARQGRCDAESTKSSADFPTLRLGRTSEASGPKISLPLMKNTQFIYELNLARLELTALNGDPQVEVLSDLRRLRTRHNEDREDLLRKRLAYFQSVNMGNTAYYELQVYNISRSVNQYLTHWFYPYKGKFHPQVVRALLNILRVPSGATVLDPFGGVGTTALECMLLGINSVSVDISEVATRVACAKVEAWRKLDEIRDTFSIMLDNPPLVPDSMLEQPIFDIEEPPLLMEQEAVKNFFVVAALIAHSDTGRRKKDFITAYRDRCVKMFESIRLLDKAVSDLGLCIGQTDTRRADVRGLPLEDESVDAIITSPPYSIALNYVENDKHALEALGLSLDKAKDEYIGVRGSGQGKITAYEDDMRRAVREMARVLKPGGHCAIIIGNPTHLAEEIRADDLIDNYCQEEKLQIWEEPGIDMSHRIPKTVYGLYNVITVEQILLFSKPGTGAKLLPKAGT